MMREKEQDGLVYVEGKRIVTMQKAVLNMIKMGRREDFELEEEVLRIYESEVRNGNYQQDFEFSDYFMTDFSKRTIM